MLKARKLTLRLIQFGFISDFIINFCLNFFLSGQVRQMRLEEEEDQHKLMHITIPAAYSSGITLFALRDSALGRELLDAPELPLL